MKKAASVDDYIASGGDWKESLALLRELFASTALEEDIKWGMPVYTLKGKNVAGFSAFKSWTGIWFYQGVFLKDIAGKLINAQRNKAVVIPEELKLAFRNNPALKDQFEALSLSKRRDYAEHIGSAKREDQATTSGTSHSYDPGGHRQKRQIQ